MNLRGPKLLARKYVKPEQIGSIVMNPAWRTDNSRSLWEVEESTAEANEALRVELEPDWILVTSPNSGVFLDYAWDDGERYEVFLLAASSVLRIIPWTTETEEVKVKGERVLVRQDEAHQPSKTIIVTDARRPTTATVIELGDEVDDPDIVEGARVLYTIHAGIEVELNGEKLLLLDQKNVLAVLEEGEVVA